jgi:hypothetical protein
VNLPHRRRSRPRGAARLALTGDFPPDGRDITEALADYDGATYQWPAPPDGVTPVAIKQAGQDTQPLARLRAQPSYTPPPILLAGQQAPWVMTVNPARPGDPGPTPQALEVVRFLRAKVTILRKRKQLDRISQDKLAMLPADRIRNRRTTARLIVDEAAELLRCGGDPR